MRNIHKFTIGPSRTNCYILHGDAAIGCCIIDPGDEAEVILQFLEEQGRKPEAILLTHGHFDHVGAVAQIREATGCAVWMAEADDRYPMEYQPLFPLLSDSGEISFFTEGQILEIAGLRIQVMHTPGHSEGSVCLLCEDAMFSGDTLFASVCGRTDLPGSDPAAMRESLKRLSRLEANYAVYPGHGRVSTLDAEKRNNPYLQGFFEE